MHHTRSHDSIRPAGAPTVDPYGPGVPHDNGMMDKLTGFLGQRGAAGAVGELRDAGRRKPMIAVAALSALAIAAITVFFIRR